MEFSRQENCHFLLQGNLPDSGIEPRPSALQADSLPSEPPGKPRILMIHELWTTAAPIPSQLSHTPVRGSDVSALYPQVD